MKKLAVSRILLFSVFLIVFLATGCGGGKPPKDDPPSTPVDAELGEPLEDPVEGTEPIAETDGALSDLKSLIDSGALTATVNSTADYDTQTGGAMGVTLTNNTEDRIFVSIPCGMVFGPVDVAYQNMMVIQEVTVEIDAGMTVTVDTTVICINSERSYPGVGTGYVVSVMWMM